MYIRKDVDESHETITFLRFALLECCECVDFLSPCHSFSIKEDYLTIIF